MKWQRIEKSHSERPQTGGYRDWKPQLASEGKHRCVYCSIHDNRWGGERIFHVEHYRPKSKFKNLINDYNNLFYACPVCNVFKSNSWIDATAGDWTACQYPNPADFDYTEFFTVEDTKSLTGVNVVGTFLIERLHLNRRHLIMERRQEFAEDKLEALHPVVEGIINELNEAELREIVKLQTAIEKFRSKDRQLPSYTSPDLK